MRRNSACEDWAVSPGSRHHLPFMLFCLFWQLLYNDWQAEAQAVACLQCKTVTFVAECFDKPLLLRLL